MFDKKLVNVANQIDADILIEILKDNEINAIQKASGSGGYMQIATGMNVFGIDIYVDEEAYEKAKEISDSFFTKDSDIVMDQDRSDHNSVSSKEERDIKTGLPFIYRIFAGVALAVIVVGILWSIWQTI